MTNSPFVAHNGFELPPVGFGTYKLRGVEGAASVASALGVGYRLLDSAVNYENESTVAHGMAESDVARSDIIYTTKLPGRAHAYDVARPFIEESFYRAGAEPIDLLLIHWPNPSQKLYVDAWRALIDARDDGFVKQIGVSNFNRALIEELQQETGETPVVNQVELHPSYPQEELVAFHQEAGIITEAWSPLGRGADFLDASEVQKVASGRGISAVQAVLAWHVARGIVPIPKASGEERQRANLAAGDIALTEEEVTSISTAMPDGSLRGWTPYNHEEM